jgi:Fe-S oxidoreductase
VGLASLVMISPGTVSTLLALAAVALLLAGATELALGIGAGGPMKHAVAGLLHLAFHPRPARFDGGRIAGCRSTDLKPLDLETRDYGIGKPADFAWNQLLGFDACVECGKCEAACPAFAAGQPLNPKKLVQDLVAGFTGSSDLGYRGSPYPGRAVGQHFGRPGDAIVPSLIGSESLWSCTTCRACVEECPMMIEHVDAVVGMRRHLNLVHGEAPGRAAEALASLRETATQGGFDTRRRYAWAADLDLPVARPDVPFDVLLVAGEGAFDVRYQRTLRALVKIMKSAKVDFAVLGGGEDDGDELDTGDLARRLGDEATFQKLAASNVARLRPLAFRRIVTADPHVLHSLRNEYPAMGGRYEVVHHTALILELITRGAIRLDPLADKRRLTYHDPCYLARYNGETEAPRMVLAALGLEFREMERTGTRSRCCGGGGGAPLTDIPGKARIPDLRMTDARAAGAGIVAVACPQCTAMLEGVAGERPEVLDVAELVANAMVGSERERRP